MTDPFDQLNLHHLRYFWSVAREGSLVAAARRLRISHSTLSTQIHALEEQLGTPLVARAGRRLRLTEMGQHVFRFADDMFAIGRDMLGALASGRAHAPRLEVGAVDSVPKMVVRRLLWPALGLSPSVCLVCHEGPAPELLSKLSLHQIEVVIADSPAPAEGPLRLFSHALGQSAVGWFAAPTLIERLRGGFPHNINGAPLLMPLQGTAARRGLDTWLAKNDLHPDVVGEFEDSALLKVFGAAAAGLFPAPVVVRSEVEQQYGVQMVGATDVLERLFIITAERQIRHPAVAAITEHARNALTRDNASARSETAKAKPRSRHGRRRT